LSTIIKHILPTLIVNLDILDVLRGGQEHVQETYE
jgi:hypothetical protein